MKPWLVTLFVLVVGCSSSSSTSTTPPPADGGGGADGGDATVASGDQEKAYCDAFASHATCNGNSPTACDPQGKCLYGHLMTSAAAASYNACYAAPSCKSDDACIDEAGQAVGGADATTYSNDCVTKLDSCSLSSRSSVCSPALFVYTGVIDALKACLGKDCSELGACLDAAVAPIKACKG